MSEIFSMPSFLVSALFVLSTLGLDADAMAAGSEKKWNAPNGSMVAVATTFKPNQNAELLNWDVVAISDRSHRVIAALSLMKGSGISHAVVSEAVWSSDSRFFCFQTSSSGGHSVWRLPTYIFDAKTSRIYSIDDTIGAVTTDNSALHFTAGGALHVDLYNFKAEKDSDSFFLSRDLDLPAFVESAKVAVRPTN